MTTVSEVLAKVPDILRERGWCRYVNEDSEGRVCLNGAVKAALGIDPQDSGANQAPRLGAWEVYSTVNAVLAQQLPSGRRTPGGIPDWNDEQQSVDAVLAVVERARVATLATV